MNETIQQFLSGKQVVAPFDVEVDGALYHCEQVLRLLPGRRLVVKALHQGQPLLLKLLVPNKKGWRELSREQHGYKLCTQAGISVPKERFISDSLCRLFGRGIRIYRRCRCLQPGEGESCTADSGATGNDGELSSGRDLSAGYSHR